MTDFSVTLESRGDTGQNTDIVVAHVLTEGGIQMWKLNSYLIHMKNYPVLVNDSFSIPPIFIERDGQAIRKYC